MSIKKLKKLVVKEFVVQEDDRRLTTGDVYTYFVDDAGILYRPREGFTVTGENLMNRFEEVGELEGD